MLNPTIPNIKNANNEELASLALNCLEELERRGNSLNRAKQDIEIFLNDIIVLQQMFEEMELMLDQQHQDEHLN